MARQRNPKTYGTEERIKGTQMNPKTYGTKENIKGTQMNPKSYGTKERIKGTCLTRLRQPVGGTVAYICNRRGCSGGFLFKQIKVLPAGGKS